MKSKNLLRFIAEVAIFAALGLVLDYLCSLIGGFAWSQGGSVSIAMVPIFLMGIKYGPKGGFLTGLLVGTIQILWSTQYGLFSTFFDYIFAYTSVGIASLFVPFIRTNNKVRRNIFICISIFVACVVRCACHIISGMVVFEATFLFSIQYNASFLALSMPLCMIIVCIVNETLHPFLVEKK